MKLKRLAVILFATLAIAIPAAAQMGMGMGGRIPTLSGVWRPVVGTGASYEIAKPDGTKMPMEITIVGKEDVDGKPAYWMEMSMVDPRTSTPVYVKSLTTVNENNVVSSRMIMQMPGQDPMEMDGNMAAQARRMQQSTPSDINDKAEVVGTESVTVPAGTFTCQHYRMKDGSGEAWVSDKVGPWGLVKGVNNGANKGETMVLTKVITDAKDHITGTPKKFDPMQMMRNRQQGQ
ncbi:MAG TPA: hypothetical protein VG272_05845 [Candidatus Acidoferrales bacterium]|jgi:hypothetical protein|nr:hypothetical protein [Candidatus Acidoferrales bacterium]